MLACVSAVFASGECGVLCVVVLMGRIVDWMVFDEWGYLPNGEISLMVRVSKGSYIALLNMRRAHVRDGGPGTSGCSAGTTWLFTYKQHVHNSLSVRVLRCYLLTTYKGSMWAVSRLVVGVWDSYNKLATSSTYPDLLPERCSVVCPACLN